MVFFDEVFNFFKLKIFWKILFRNFFFNLTIPSEIFFIGLFYSVMDNSFKLKSVLNFLKNELKLNQKYK